MSRNKQTKKKNKKANKQQITELVYKHTKNKNMDKY